MLVCSLYKTIIKIKTLRYDTRQSGVNTTAFEYSHPLLQKCTCNHGWVCWLQPQSIPIDQTHLHTVVNINISCLRMFLEQHGLIKDSTDGPHVLFYCTSSFCWKMNKPEILLMVRSKYWSLMLLMCCYVLWVDLLCLDVKWSITLRFTLKQESSIGWRRREVLMKYYTLQFIFVLFLSKAMERASPCQPVM